MAKIQVKEDNKLFELADQIKGRLSNTSYYAGEIEGLKEQMGQVIDMVTFIATRLVEQNHMIMSNDDLSQFIGHSWNTKLVVDGNERQTPDE